VFTTGTDRYSDSLNGTLNVFCRGLWTTRRQKATWRACRWKGDTWEMFGDVYISTKCEPHP